MSQIRIQRPGETFEPVKINPVKLEPVKLQPALAQPQVAGAGIGGTLGKTAGAGAGLGGRLDDGRGKGLAKALDSGGLDSTSLDSKALGNTAPLRISPAYGAFKRGFDLAIAVALLPPVTLICLLVACLNPLLNPGPLFFVQTRIGRGEAPFRMVKLRTMVDDGTVARLNTDERHRITRFGAFLRSKRLDELPQILNILLGQMSFIGPRPEQRELYDEILGMIPRYQARQVVRPGISGLAQVQSGYARDAAELRVKLRYDMHYIRHMGFRMDTYVLLQTVRVALTGFGAR